MKPPKLDERAKAAGVTWELAAESENGEGRIFWNPKIFGKGIYVTVDESWIQGCVDYAEAVKEVDTPNAVVEAYLHDVRNGWKPEA